MKLAPACHAVAMAMLLATNLACPDSVGPTDPITPNRTVCGNNRAQSGEVCDGSDLEDQTCGQLGFGAGSLGCKNDCKDFDRAGCGAPSTCGNGGREGVEICDGADLGGQICEDLGLGPGVLGCLFNCADFDTTLCAPPPDCGDNEINGPAELCDGVDLDRLSCRSFGFESGDLRCAPDCLSFDRSDCVAGSDAGVPDGTVIGSDASRPDSARPDSARPDSARPDSAVPWDPALYGAPCSSDSQCTDQGTCLDAWGTGAVCWHLCQSVSECYDMPYATSDASCGPLADGFPQVCHLLTGQNGACGNPVNAICGDVDYGLCGIGSNNVGTCVRVCNPTDPYSDSACRVSNAVPDLCGCLGGDACSTTMLAFDSGDPDNPDGICAPATSTGSYCGLNQSTLVMHPCTGSQVCDGLSETNTEGTCAQGDAGVADGG